jgi:hypothetical protein
MTYRDAWVLQKCHRMKCQLIRQLIFPNRLPDGCVVIHTNDDVWAPSIGSVDGGEVVPFRTAAER